MSAFLLLDSVLSALIWHTLVGSRCRARSSAGGSHTGCRSSGCHVRHSRSSPGTSGWAVRLSFLICRFPQHNARGLSLWHLQCQIILFSMSSSIWKSCLPSENMSSLVVGIQPFNYLCPIRRNACVIQNNPNFQNVWWLLTIYISVHYALQNLACASSQQPYVVEKLQCLVCGLGQSHSFLQQIRF